MVNLGVIGLGRIGQLHTENILKHVPEFTIKGIADPAIDTLSDWVNGLPIVVKTHDHHKIINDNEIDAVLICTPSDMHVPIIIQAAHAKKAIFCEKPISLDIKEIKQALDVILEEKVKFQVGFNRRFDKNFMALKDSITQGLIGDPYMVKITSRDPAPPDLAYLKKSGGLFLDMSIHDFDMARYLIDDEIVEIYANGENLLDIDLKDINDIDTAMISFRFKNGVLGAIDNSRQAVYGYDQRVEVFGSLGSISAENEKINTVESYTKEGHQSQKPPYFFLERYQQAYIDELKAFYDYVTGKREVPISGRDGLISVVIGKACQQSLKENKPIQVSWK